MKTPNIREYHQPCSMPQIFIQPVLIFKVILAQKNYLVSNSGPRDALIKKNIVVKCSTLNSKFSKLVQLTSVSVFFIISSESALCWNNLSIRRTLQYDLNHHPYNTTETYEYYRLVSCHEHVHFGYHSSTVKNQFINCNNDNVTLLVNQGLLLTLSPNDFDHWVSFSRYSKYTVPPAGVVTMQKYTFLSINTDNFYGIAMMSVVHWSTVSRDWK